MQNNCTDVLVNSTSENINLRLEIHNLNNYTKCDTLLDTQKDWLSKNHLNYFGSLKLTNEVIRMLSEK